MIRVCMDCERVLGEKAPLADKRISHGLCKKCFKKRMQEIKQLRLDKSQENGE